MPSKQQVIWSSKKEHKELKDRVKDVMRKKKGARNSDQFLMWYFWRYEQDVDLEEYDSFKEGKSASTLVRLRREIQNEDQELLPTKADVLKQRKFKEDEIREFYSRDRAQEILEDY